MSDRCVSIECLLEPTDEDLDHLARCAECADLASDLASLRGRAAALDSDGWAGEAAPAVDVEAALACVLAQADRIPSRTRRPLLVQLATSLAAAAVLFSLAAPSLLRWRVESSPSAQAGGGEAMQGVFWTTVAPGP